MLVVSLGCSVVVWSTPSATSAEPAEASPVDPAAEVARTSGELPIVEASTPMPPPSGRPVSAPLPMVTPTPLLSSPGAVPAPPVPSDDVPKMESKELSGFDEDESFEVESLRDAHSTTFQNPDGTLTVQLSSMPVHFKDAKGSWQPVDNRIVLDEKGHLTNAANEWRVTFLPMTNDGGVAFDTPDGSVRFSAQGAAAVSPVVEPDGESVRYVGVFPDTDLVYRVNGAGVEEFLVLTSARAMPAVTFTMHGAQFDSVAGGLDARGGGIGSRLRIAEPETFDAAGRAVDPEHQVFETTDVGRGVSTVSVGLRAEYVASLPAEAFPVVVDPSVAVGVGASWVMSYKNHTGNGAADAYFNDGWARVGNPYASASSDLRWRSTVLFDYSPYLSSNVIDAYMTTNMSGGSTTGPRALNVWWASQFGFHHGVAPNAFNQYDPPSPATSSCWCAYLSSTINTGVEYHYADAPNTDWFTMLYNNLTRTGTNGAVLLLTGDESATYTLKKFTVGLTLTINRWPAAPTGAASGSGRTVSFWGAAASDPDGDATRFMYRAYNVTTGAVIDSYGTGTGLLGDWTSNTSFTYQLPQSWAGQVVQPQIFTWDGVCWHAECHVTGSSVGAQFTVGNAPPGAGTPTLPPNGLQSHSLTQTLTAAAASDPNGSPPQPAGTANTDPVYYAFFQCTSAACTTKTYFHGWQPSSGGTWSLNTTFTTPFYGTTLWWGVDTYDGQIVTSSALRTITFTNQQPTATNVAPVDSALLQLPNTTLQMPTLLATVADADDLSLDYRFEVRPAGGTGLLAASPWSSVTQTSLGAGVARSFALPEWLSSRTGYTWTVRVRDANGAVGQSATWTLKTQSRLGADAASPMQPAGPVQVNLATGNLFLAAGGGKSVATVGGPMSVGFSYNSQDQSGLGLRGTYYVDADADNTPDPGEVRMVRTDSVPSFDWGLASPGEAVPADGFKVRWDGTVRVPTGGSWLFAGGHDDNIKITITKNTDPPVVVYQDSVVTDLGAPAVFDTATAITLTPSDIAKIQIDYFDGAGNGYVEVRAKTTTLPGEYPVSASWFTTGADRVLPAGWTLSAASGIDPLWVKVEVNETEATVTGADGSQTVWTKDVEIVGGTPVTSWIAPDEVDDTLSVNWDGTVTIHAGDGLLYRFAANGSLTDVTSAADDLKPAGAKRIYSPGTDPSATPRLTRLEDRVAPTRTITLRYNQAGLGPCPAAPAGFDANPPAGMLCAVEYPDNTATRLYYSAGLLARISDPGDETAAGATPAPEGRAVTELIWASGRLTDVLTPSDVDRVTAQTGPGSTIPAGDAIPATDLRTTLTWAGERTQTVTLARPTAGAARPQFTLGYPGATMSTVTIAGIAAVSRTVTFDEAGRTLTDADAVGRTTTTTWAAGTDAVLRTISGGRQTTTIYDNEWHPLDVYGPAPTACFAPTSPYAPNGCASGVPRTHTDYDDNLKGLQGAFWATANFSPETKGHGMGPNGGGHIDYSWPDTTLPPGVTNPDSWSARFSGLIYPPTTGNYAFRLITGPTDTATVYLDDYAQLRTIAGTTDVSTGSINLNTTNPIKIRIDFTAGTGTSTLRFGWGLNGTATNFAIGDNLKPGFWYPTRTTTYDTPGSSQVPAATVTETRFDEGADPVYGLLTSTTRDPAGLALSLDPPIGFWGGW